MEFETNSFPSGKHDLLKSEERSQQNTIFAQPVPHAHTNEQLQISTDSHVSFAADVFKIRQIDPGDSHKYIYQVLHRH